MNAIAPPPELDALPGLIDRLRASAELWAQVNTASLSALASAVLNDSGYFARIAVPAPSTTTRTLEKFARFLVDPANWPGGAAPEEVCAFAHAVGISGAACAVSPDIGGDFIEAVPEGASASPEGLGSSPSGRTSRMLPAGALNSPPDPCHAGQPAAAGSSTREPRDPVAAGLGGGS